jgi:single-strand DNA-binding protein
MASFNRVTLIGNLTRDPQSKALPSGSTVCEFGLATSRRFKGVTGEDREEVCFVDCAAFGKQADLIQEFCQKGRQLFVEGRLKYDAWDDKTTGAKRSKLTVVIENFQFLGSRDGAGSSDQRGEGESIDRSTDQTRGEKRQWKPTQNRLFGGQRERVKANAKPEQPFGDEEQFKEADIPF